jgi:hypothetical protein
MRADTVQQGNAGFSDLGQCEKFPDILISVAGKVLQ